MVCLLKGQGLSEIKDIKSFIVHGCGLLHKIYIFNFSVIAPSVINTSRANTVSTINSSALLLTLYAFYYEKNEVFNCEIESTNPFFEAIIGI